MTEAKMTARKSKITIPERCDPRAKLVFAEMRRQAVTYDELEWRSGVLRSTFKAWRSHNAPSIQTVDAALGVLGWHLLPIPKLETIAPELRADLEAIAEKHRLSALPHPELVAACIGYRRAGSHIDARTRFKAPGVRLANAA